MSGHIRENKMPYIKKEQRNIFESDIARLVNNLSAQGWGISKEGCLNYIISSLLARSLREEEMSYAKLNAVMGILESCKAEIYRRVVAPYEEIKLRENGEI